MEAPAEAAPAALIASSNHKRALETQNATATRRALIGNALALLRGCAPLTPRYGVYCFLYLGVDGLAF